VNRRESPAAVLISIHPRFVEQILTGSKTVELRRRPPRVSPGTPVLIYATRPESKVVGRFKIGKNLSKPREQLWRHVRESAGVSKGEYDSYFADAAEAHAIEIRAPQRLRRPVSLSIPPPQSYRFLYATDPSHTALLRRVRCV
jgi:predicted transcriptional regulator